MKHEIQQVFATTAERLWDTYFFDEAFNEGLHERLGLRLDERSLQHEGAGPTLVVRRRLRYTARRMLPRLPEALRRVLGQGDVDRRDRGFLCAAAPLQPAPRAARGSCRSSTAAANSRGRRCPAATCGAAGTGAASRACRSSGAGWRATCSARWRVGLAESHLFLSRWIREHPVTAVLAAR